LESFCLSQEFSLSFTTFGIREGFIFRQGLSLDLFTIWGVCYEVDKPNVSFWKLQKDRPLPYYISDLQFSFVLTHLKER